MVNTFEDTICAVSTALTPSGVGIIRVSGDNSKKFVSSIFVDKNKNYIDLNKSHKIYYGYIFDKKNNEFLDEVLVLTMFAPHSYTAEDVIEIQTHGSPIVLKKVLSLLTSLGCRIAEPGEFTKRAFLNGRIDLSKAESVSDIIMSKNNYALKASFNQLKGNLSDKLNNFRNTILSSIAFIEACLDDPEHMSVEGYKPTLKTTCENIIKELDNIINNYDNGRMIKEGINTVILGKPNVGKSSLLNTLLNEERAIVTDIAGTTRDTIKESINLNGLTLNIIDTAGIRNEKDIDRVERIGIDRAKEEAGKADLIILVLDSSKPLDKDDEELIGLCKGLGKRTITLLNKNDLGSHSSPLQSGDLGSYNSPLRDPLCTGELCEPLVARTGEFHEPHAIAFSTKTKAGLHELTTTIETLFLNKELDFNNEIFISNERQLQSIKKAKTSIQNVLSSISNNMPEDLLTIDLNDAYTQLSQVLGIEVNDDVVNEIFSKFCMGK